MSIKTPTSLLIDTSQDDSLSGVITHQAPSKKISPFNPNLVKFQWVKDKFDARDYLYQASTSKLNDIVDLRQYCTLIENQENLGSCTGQALAGAIEYLNKKNGRVVDVSRLYIYYFERMYLGTINWDSGAYIRDGIKSVYNYGAPLERLWPYIVSRFRLRPSNSVVQDGLKRKVTRYERITDLGGCINAIANGYPVTVGFLVYSSFMSNTVVRTGMMPYPNVRTESLLGGHAVLLVGYDNIRRRFIARNSWGVRWGDRGYFYMPYDVIDNRQMSDDFWIIKSVNNPR